MNLFVKIPKISCIAIYIFTHNINHFFGKVFLYKDF